MWSNETATATTGGPPVIDIFYGNGRHRAQIIYFFRMQIGSRTPSGLGLGSGSRLRRMRQCSVLPRELWIPKLWGIMRELRALLGTCTDMYSLMEVPAYAA